ncbi:hypothetical protein RRG08_006879 [Elysia crispata]|uniref:Uncharacterized protein n=1 Tax=Elysia crispata TaxID=231223 RepID=A0AAE1B9L8_9GAST|nr:hypothetical protein RRG08_007307 [Elysia crispata]KAK3801162.1 hypothetical protein RRG08_006879 [Elysia crispata]
MKVMDFKEMQASVLDDNYISLKKTFLAEGKGRRPDLSHLSVRRSRRNCFFNCTVCVPRARTHGVSCTHGC